MKKENTDTKAETNEPNASIPAWAQPTSVSQQCFFTSDPETGAVEMRVGGKPLIIRDLQSTEILRLQKAAEAQKQTKPSPETIVCPTCGNKVTTRQFCPECGTRLFCPNCGMRVHKTNYCPECGTKLL